MSVFESEGQYYLEIPRVSAEDAGEYTCTASNSEGSVSCSVAVFVESKCSMLGDWWRMGVCHCVVTCRSVCVLSLVWCLFTKCDFRHKKQQAKNNNQHLIILDNSLYFEQHMSNICRIAYLELRRISSIRHYLSVDATKILICSFVLSRIDCCNYLLAGLLRLIGKLQRFQHNAVHLIFQSSRYDHISPLLESLHWLPISQQIDYKFSSLCHSALTVVVLAHNISLSWGGGGGGGDERRIECLMLFIYYNIFPVCWSNFIFSL